MVRFDWDFTHTRAIFIDGYCQGEDFYREVNLRSLRTTKKETSQKGKLPSLFVWRRIWQPLHEHDMLTSNQLIKMFIAFVEGARTVYCPLEAARPSRSGIQRYSEGVCGYLTFGTGTTYNSLIKGLRRRQFAEQLPYLKREYENDREGEGGHYVQNLILVPQVRKCHCNEYDTCIGNWEQITGFHEKTYDLYEHLPSFETAWKSIAGFYVRRHEADLAYRAKRRETFPSANQLSGK